MGPGRFTLKALGTFVGAAGFVTCLVVLYRCMRSVMMIGGACATGGPYLIANPCPEGVGWMSVTSIFLGMFMLLVLGVANLGLPGPKLVLFAWSALFLALGANFWEFGLDPQDGRSVDVGWLVCAVLFFVMGGLPLLAGLSPRNLKAALWNDGNLDGSSGLVSSGARWLSPQTARTVLQPAIPKFSAIVTRAARTGAATAGPAVATSTIADGLAQLASLHRDGQLTDAEFTAAKARLIEGA